MNLKHLIKTFVLVVFIAGCFNPSYGQTENGDNQRLNLEMVYNRQLGTWFEILTRNHEDASYKKSVAYNMYAYLFDFWVIDKNKKTTFLDPGVVRTIVKLGSPYVDGEDPLMLNKYYDGDRLTGMGVLRLRWQPLNDGDQLFSSRQQYRQYVADFNVWLKKTLSKGVSP